MHYHSQSINYSHDKTFVWYHLQYCTTALN